MIGTSLGPYKILELLGAGGMGEVYLGEDTRLGRKVAIKVLPAEFASDPARPLRADAAALAGMTEARLAEAFQAGPDNPLVGLAGRAALLRRLGQALTAAPALFGAARPASTASPLRSTRTTSKLGGSGPGSGAAGLTS